MGYPRARLTESVTAIVKTFERPAILSRLLESAHRLFPNLKIMLRTTAVDPG